MMWQKITQLGLLRLLIPLVISNNNHIHVWTFEQTNSCWRYQIHLDSMNSSAMNQFVDSSFFGANTLMIPPLWWAVLGLLKAQSLLQRGEDVAVDKSDAKVDEINHVGHDTMATTPVFSRFVLVICTGWAILYPITMNHRIHVWHTFTCAIKMNPNVGKEW